VLALTQEDATLGEALVAGLPHIRAEVAYAIRKEMAQTIEDILARRLGLQLFDWRKAMEAAPTVGDLLAAELRWTREQRDAAVNSYVEKIRGFLAALLKEVNRGRVRAV
jgi:glycerol-3-phosphate dehydrogenase